MKKSIGLACALLVSAALSQPVYGAATDSNSQEVWMPLPEPFVKDVYGVVYGSSYREPKPTKIYEEAITTPQTKETKQEETTEETVPEPETGQGAESQTGAESPSPDRLEYEREPGEFYFEGGTAYQDGKPLYRVDNRLGEVTIYPYAFRQAVEEERDLIIQLKDEQGRVWYRIRYALEDLEAADLESIGEAVFNFKQRCDHEKAADKLIKRMETGGMRLLLCRQKGVDIPVYIGVRAPEDWIQDLGVYQYVYNMETGSFELSDTVTSIDGEWIVETRMEELTDVVFAQEKVTPFEMRTWVEGVMKGNSRVDRQRALFGASLTLLGGGGIIAFGGFLWRKENFIQ